MRTLKNNAPVVIIAALTLLCFAVIIYFASRTDQQTVSSQSVDQSTLVTADSHIQGEATASATLVEFSDFECPACGAFYPIVKAVQQEFGTKLRFAYKHFPLPQHTYAFKAAQASEAAAAQGKFWAYHDVLFENQQNLTDADLVKYAGQVGLDVKKFSDELNSGKYASRVQEDMNLGNSLGIDATPTFYLNGKKLTLTNVDDLKNDISQVLNTQK